MTTLSESINSLKKDHIIHDFHHVHFKICPFFRMPDKYGLWPALLNVLVCQSKTVSAAINNGHDVYLRWPVLIGTASFY